MSISELGDALKAIENITNVKEEKTDNDGAAYSFGSLDYYNDEVGIMSYTYLIQTRGEVKLVTFSNSFEYDTIGLYSNTRLFKMVNDFNSTYMGYKAFVLEKRKDESNIGLNFKREKNGAIIVTFNTDLVFYRHADLFKEETKKSFTICLNILSNAPSLFSGMMTEYGIRHKNISNESM
ncbi:hypothetical protein CXH12_02495 [Citrobacter portucalensis]|uniref:hypothetical protein n=1 Tax=Citrobacter portucalensis TaxID=1639133 RepID=UPI000C9EF9EB|nr:hypothetical protein [Citrobacter portucalensis]PKQ51333.1 hypothetical protein CXH12_02495 [Citrobacter portucalensis]